MLVVILRTATYGYDCLVSIVSCLYLSRFLTHFIWFFESVYNLCRFLVVFSIVV